MAPIPRELLQLPRGHTLADRVRADLAFRAKFRATVAAMGSVATEVDGLPGPPWHRRCVLDHLRAAGQALVDWHDDLCASEDKGKDKDKDEAHKAGSRKIWSDVEKTIAVVTQLKMKDVKAVFAALRTIAYAEVKKTNKFVIPQLLTIKVKHKPARKAGTNMMFGKEVKVVAKPASKVVKVFPGKAVKDSIRDLAVWE